MLMIAVPIPSAITVCKFLALPISRVCPSHTPPDITVDPVFVEYLNFTVDPGVASVTVMVFV